MERQHQRVLEQIQKHAEARRTGVSFNDVNMMHQCGGGGRYPAHVAGEAVSVLGGCCPVSAPVTWYDVSAIAVEISLSH